MIDIKRQEEAFEKLNTKKQEVMFSDIYTFKNGINKEKEYFGYGNKIVNYMDVNRFTQISEHQISGLVKCNETELSRYSALPNDLFFTRTSESSEEIGLSCALTSSEQNTVFSGFILRARPINMNNNSIFYSYMFRSNEYRKKIIRHSSITTRALTSGSLIGEIKVKPQKIGTQNKIANFLTSLDSLIQKQEEYIEELKIHKKAYFTNIQSKETCIKKEILLDDILKERRELIVKGTLEHVTLSKEGVVPKTKRYDRDNLVTDDKVKKYKVTRTGDIVYNPANLKFGVLARNNYKDSIFSPIYVTYEVIEEHNSIYISEILKTANFISYIRKYEQGTVYERMSVSSEDFLRGKILVPNKLIQDKVASILVFLDTKIELQEKKLEQLKLKKKYYLNEIFR